MGANEVKRNNEWITRVRLAHYKRLSNALTLESNEKEMLVKLKQLLLEDGFTEEDITQEVLQYKELSEEEKKKQVEEKADALVSQIVSYLENIEEISSKNKPELYHRIQELLALNPDGANELISEVFDREKISHCTICGNPLFDGTCTYYFSKKPYSHKN